MAFPSTSILDSFDRADGPPGANWGGKLFSGDAGGGAILTNQLELDATESNYWTASCGPDCQAFVTLPNVGVYGVFARILNPGTGTFAAYEIYGYQPSNVVQVYRIDNGGYVQLGADISQTIGSGDSAGIEMIGDTINVWYKVGAGAWTNIGSRTDATYGAAGYIGLESDGGGFLFEDFGGGTIGGPPLTAFQSDVFQ